VTEISWGRFSENSYHCKIQIDAEPSLNGKIIVSFDEVDAESSLYVYLQPNEFDAERSGTYGVYPNNYVYKWDASDKFYVPTDWTYYFVYLPDRKGGSIKIRSLVEELTSADAALLENFWQPTKVTLPGGEVEEEGEVVEEGEPSSLLDDLPVPLIGAAAGGFIFVILVVCCCRKMFRKKED